MKLEMRHIDKLFFGKYANQDVHLQVEEGQIHALLGENGAGKTTLMNILYGMYRKDGGTILWKGKEVDFHSPKEALAAGIGMVHQHFMLVQKLTVSQNMSLGLREKGYPFTDRRHVNKKMKELSERYGLPLDPNAMVENLSVGEQQRVEIMKLLYRGAELMILDEPTAVLTPQETKLFFEVLKKLKQEGCSVIIITHRIPEVMDIADAVTILRDTRSVFTGPIGGLNEVSLSEHMIGRPVKAVQRSMEKREDKEALSLKGVSLTQKGIEKLKKIDLHVGAGEIVGLAGVDGNGQKALAEVILGIRKHTMGSVALCGEIMDEKPVSLRKKAGMAYISDDRHHDSLVMDMDLVQNMFLKFHTDARFSNHGILKQGEMREKTKRVIEEYNIKTPSAQVPIRYLSGGNQQKLILAREMSDSPTLIVAFQPTRGLDLGAAQFVHEQLQKHCKAGAAVLLISADLEEVLALSNRIAVIHAGAIMGIFDNCDEPDYAAIGLMMAGKQAAQEGGMGS